ncbi:hypothetical protein KR067_001636, partial [Drosophila pandora]
VGLVLLYAGALKAQDPPAADTTAAVAVTTDAGKGPAGAEATTAAGDGTGVTGGTSGPPSTAAGNATTHNEASHEDHHMETTPENGGDPYVSPGKHRPGPRHVKAHDGFHNIKNEKHWATWNDAFTTAAL